MSLTSESFIIDLENLKADKTFGRRNTCVTIVESMKEWIA